jgi:hypothetical protein
MKLFKIESIRSVPTSHYPVRLKVHNLLTPYTIHHRQELEGQ